MDSATRYQQILARDSRYDGQFITGVLSTGIYCLPSCPARKPKFDNVRFFAKEAQARKAGLRPCLRCRPDLFYRGTPADETVYEALLQRLSQADGQLGTVAELARLAGVSRAKLSQLCRRHGHTSPAAILRRGRLDWAAQQLLQQAEPVAAVGFAAGFVSETTFHRQFLQAYAMTPAAYRGLTAASEFSLRLPDGYRSAEVLAYLGRDSGGPAERLQGNSLVKAVLLAGQPVRLSLRIEPAMAHCQVLSDGVEPSPAQMAMAHRLVLRCLGLASEAHGLTRAAAGAADIARLLGNRTGLRFPLSATVFEALVWAIVGQQVNLTFAASLRRTVIELAGRDAGAGMLAHPDVVAVAALDPAVLCTRQFSRSKAEYLVGTARHLRDTGWDVETLPQQSVPAALRRLTAIRGIGPWTAQYTLLRGAGFADCVPVGDAGLVAALQRFFGLDSRPDVDQTLALMQGFAPWRSLATAHLWASLKEPA